MRRRSLSAKGLKEGATRAITPSLLASDTAAAPQGALAAREHSELSERSSSKDPERQTSAPVCTWPQVRSYRCSVSLSVTWLQPLPMSRRIFIVRHGERSDGPGLPPPPDDGFSDAPLTVAGLFQARCTAAALKTLMGPLSAAVVSSPARRCLQTAKPIAEALQASLYVEPGLADWSETRLPVQVTLPELGLEVRHLGPVWAEPLEEETWEVAVRRYRETYAGLASISSDSAVSGLVLCSHQAALEALAPASWTQGHCAVTELSGIPPVPGSLLHDCSAWRRRFVFVASREPRPRYWRAKLGTPTRARPLEPHGDFWTVAAADVEAHLTVTSSKRERPLLLFFLDVTGELIHLACGLAVSANEAGELTLAGAQRLRWSSGPGGELLNDKGVHLAVRNGAMPTLWMKEGSSDDCMAFDLVPLGKAGLGLGPGALADAEGKDSAS
ncbi:TFC7 [Symbiodinium sp. CCMP2456]|nr:TFC7 [Symbiodinium sp. CCMP2456]